MKVTFLGTGTSQGVPVITCACDVCCSDDSRDKRLRSSILIRTENQNIVIDAGPDFRYQMLRAGIKTLDAILLTHEHKDHVGGMDDIRPFNYVQQSPINIYGENRVLKALREHEFAYVFADKKYPGIPKMNLNIIENKPFSVNDVQVIPVRGMHHKLPVFGFRINNMAYITDMNYIAPEEKQKLKNLDLLIITALRREKHISHFNLEQTLAVIEEVRPKQAYLTHMSHYIGLHADLEKELPENIAPAYDTLSVIL